MQTGKKIKNLSSNPIVRWALIIAVCLAPAYFLARWWTVRSEERFQAHLEQASIPELQQIAQRRDWDPMVYYWLGAKLTTEGRHQEAVRALARSVALNPHSAAARATFGLALARIDHPSEAETQLKTALTINPRLTMAHFALGNLYGRYKRWQQAAEQLKAVNKEDPNDLEAQYLLSLCYGEMFQEDRKMELLEQLTRRAPDNVRYLKSLGYVLLFFGKFAEAEATYRHILALEPNDIETHYLLGRALAEQASSPAMFASAEQELQGVVQKAPQNPAIHLALGILYFRRNEPARAVPELERAIQLGTTEHKTWMYLGQSYARVGRAADAKRTLDTFQKGASINREVTQLENRLFNSPEDNEARLRLARVYMDTHDYSRALNHLRVLLDKNNPVAAKLAYECQERIRSTQAKSGNQMGAPGYEQAGAAHTSPAR